jgi:hypothetical protein
MNGWMLLVIGLASLGLVVFAFAYLGYCGYRMAKAGIDLARKYGPISGELAKKAALATEQATAAGVSAQEIAATMTRLQASLQRLQIVVEAWQTAVTPYRKVREYFGR